VSDDLLAPPAASPVADASARGRGGGWQRLAQRYGALAVLIALFVYNAVATPYFLTFQTLVNTDLQQAAPIAIVAIGMALVISTGGIDLSVGSVMAIAGQVGALMIVNGFGAYLSWAGALLAALVRRREVRRHPELVAQQAAAYSRLESELAAVLADRLPGPDAGLRARVLAATFLAVLRVTIQHWTDVPEGALLDTVRAALAAAAPA
jgi:hypothetical protein